MLWIPSSSAVDANRAIYTQATLQPSRFSTVSQVLQPQDDEKIKMNYSELPIMFRCTLISII